MHIKEGYIFRQIDDHTGVVVPVGQATKELSGIITLNSTGSFLWQRMTEKKLTLEEAVAALTSAFEVDAEVARRDVLEFIKKAREAGVLEDNG